MLSKFEEWFSRKYGISIDDIENPLINQPSELGKDEAEDNRPDSIDSDALAYIRAKKKVKFFELKFYSSINYISINYSR